VVDVVGEAVVGGGILVATERGSSRPATKGIDGAVNLNFHAEGIAFLRALTPRGNDGLGNAVIAVYGGDLGRQLGVL